MKNVTLSLLAAAASIFAAPVWAVSPSTCAVIEQRIAASTNEFVQINVSNSPAASTKQGLPAELYYNAQARRIQQQKAADKLWDLRTEMANKQCAQAARFMF